MAKIDSCIKRIGVDADDAQEIRDAVRLADGNAEAALRALSTQLERDAEDLRADLAGRGFKVDAVDLDGPVFEKVDTVDGQRDQAVIPGAQQDATGAATKKSTAAQELARLKGKQSKMRAGKPQEDAGGMFAPVQNDLLSAPGYGESNKLVTKDRADELAKKLAAKFKGQLNSGIDPEMLAMGAELAVYHIEAGARSFVQFARNMRQTLEGLGVAWPQIKPYVRGWYNGARDLIEDQGGNVDGMDSSEAVRAALKDIDSASATSGRVEQDRGNPEARDGMGGARVPVQSGGTDAVPGSRDGAAGERGDRQPGGADLVPGDGAAPVGTGGDREVRPSKPAVSRRTSGDSGSDGSDLFGEPGPDPNSPREIAAAQAAPPSQGLEAALAAQKAAAGIKIIPGDRDNIDATLPFLRDHQREDVWRAETRFSKPDGWGYLFTNGTGTGKGYVMAGIAARFWRQGKQNILLTVPSQDLVTDIVNRLGNLGIPAGALEDKSTNKTAGVVVTTYANLQDNATLADRKWDLVQADESQLLMSSESGDVTLALRALRANSRHPDGLYDRARWQLRKEWAPIDEATEEARARKREPSQEIQEKVAQLDRRTRALEEQMRAEDGRANVVFLSATPFAYVKTIEYAQGYLFDWGSDRSGSGYNSGDNREAFFMQHFGYRMRTNKLTAPDAGVDTGVMERQFHEWLKSQGALSGRRLDVPFDYDRKFVLIDDAIGNRIDALLNYLNETEGMRDLAELVRRRFDYLARVRLLEAIKAKHSIPYIKAQHALGRKVVVFHDFNEGGGINPFEFDIDKETEAFWYEANKDKAGGTELVQKKAKLRDLYDQFQAENPDAGKMKFKELGSPLATLTAAFPNALQYNGMVPAKQRTEAKRLFNEDGNEFNLIIVQSRAGEFGISLHDTTAKHQRALVNLGLPTRPVTAIQEEGRIYRDGQASDAIMRYFNTGTSWEREAFARKIAERASTAENLALGNEARALRDSFINSFLESAPDQPAEGDGKGGKEADKAANAALTDWQRAVTFYHAQQKQRGNRSQREGIDYFPTPEPVGLKMVQLANIDVGEKMLEPSAGHGAVARFFPEYTDRTLIEPSTELASRAGIVAVGAKVINDRFESLNIVNKYDGIVMNPPYGSGGKTAMDHVTKAMKHLRNGGRIVALIPTGPSADRRFDDMMESDDAKGIYLAANIKLPQVTFEKAGTGVMTRIVVLERQNDADDAAKIQQTDRDYTNVETISELFDRLENMTIRPRVEPKVKDVETEADANGNITLRGVPYALTEKDPRLGGFMAKPKGKMGRDAFRQAAQHAEKNDGRYVDSTFSFPTKEARDAWIATMAQPEPAPEPVAPGAAPTGVAFNTGEVRHSKTGALIYVAAMRDRVAGPIYTAMNALAKKHGGSYSSWRGAGAMPGFHFSTAEKRAAFLAEAGQAKESRRGLIDTAANFLKWFGDSKVVDENGAPLVVFHGTAAQFDAFDKNYQGSVTETSDSLEGFWFTTSRQRAEMAAEDASNMVYDEDGRGRVMSVYLSMKNPVDAVVTMGDPEETARILRRARKQGHDGVIFYHGEKGGKDYVVFKPTQIKSTENVGTWDGTNPNIRERRPDAAPRADRINTDQLAARLAEVGIADKIVARIVERLKNDADGTYHLRLIQLSERAPDQTFTLNHEIIHALKDLGLFTEFEWMQLKTAARQNTALMANIAERYPDLTADEQIEEAIADMFARWKAQRPTGKFAQLWDKFVAFLKAIRAAVGDGYTNAGDIMQAADRGYIGRRDPGEVTNADEKDSRNEGGKEWAEERARIYREATGYGADVYQNDAGQWIMSTRNIDAGWFPPTDEQLRARGGPITQSRAEADARFINRFRNPEFGRRALDAYNAGGEAGFDAFMDRQVEPAQSKMKFSRRIQGNTSQETAINKAIAEEQTGGVVAAVKQAWQIVKSQDKTEWAWATADEFAGLRALGKQLDPDARDRDLGSYVAARLSRHSAGQIEAFLKHGAPVWDAADQSLGLSQSVGGLYTIVEPLFQSGKARLFEGYAYARRVSSQNLIAEGREKNLTDIDVQELLQLGQQHPEFVDIFDKVQAFKRAVNDAAEGMGLINAAQRQTWEQADHIPFYRAVEEDERQSPRIAKGLAGQSAQIRRLTGGDRRFVVIETATGRVVERHEKRFKANLARKRLGKTTHTVEEAGQPIVGVIENLAQNVTHLINASVRNHAAVMAIDEALAAGWAKKVPLERARALVPVQAMIRALEGKNLTIGNQQGIGGVMAITAIQPPVHPGNGIIAIRRDGQVEYYEVDDKLVYSALAGLYRGAQHPIIRFLGGFKNLLTRGVTAMPDFMARNFIRDSSSSWMLSEERGLNPLKETGKTLKAVVTRMDDPRVKAIMAAGGDTGWYQNAPEETVAQLRALERTDRIGWLSWANPLKVLERMGRASEIANRIVQYDETLKATGSRRKAAFDAADIMDFQLKGGSDFMLALTAIVPFLNARIQGLYKLGRYGTQKKSRKSLLAKAGILMAFSIILAAINADDDDDDGYNSLPEYLKDTSWAIPIYRIFGKEIADEVGLPRFLLIPKPFELGTLFATIPERMIQSIAGNDSADATLGSAARAIISTFAFNPMGNPISMEILQQWANKDVFRGEPIVGTYQQYLPPEDQYNAGTSQAARGAGKILGVSPARLEHAVRGFTGTAGMWFLEATDVIAEKFGIVPPSAKLRLDEAEIVRSFVSGSPVRNSKWVEEFYNLRDTAEGIANGIRQRRLAGDTEGANRLLAENSGIVGIGPRGGIGMAPGLDFDADRLSRISKQMKETRQSETMTPAQKREKLDELITLRNTIAKKRVQSWLEK